MKKILFIGIIGVAAALTGCGHNVNLQGFWVACPYGAIGYGTLSCTKDNVKVVSTEKSQRMVWRVAIHLS